MNYDSLDVALVLRCSSLAAVLTGPLVAFALDLGGLPATAHGGPSKGASGSTAAAALPRDARVIALVVDDSSAPARPLAQTRASTQVAGRWVELAVGPVVPGYFLAGSK